MASAEHLLQQPVDSQLAIAIAIAGASDSSDSSSCKKRPPPQHRHALAPSPKRHASSPDSPPRAASAALPSASCVSPAAPSSPSPLHPSPSSSSSSSSSSSLSSSSSSSSLSSSSSSSSSSLSSSSSANHHCSLAAQSFERLHEELSDFDASCLVDLDESEAAMSSSRQELLSEMMKALEQVLGGDAASDGVPSNFSPSTASAHAVSAARVAEISEACIAMGGDQGVTRPEPGAMESEARAELPSQAAMSEKNRPLVEDCNSSASDRSEICKAEECSAACESGILRASRDGDEDPDAKLLPSPSPPTFLSSASLSPDLTTETIETRKSFENLAKEESLQSPEACEDLLRDLLAEASRNELLSAADFDSSEQEIHAEEWEAVYCARDSRAQSSGSAADPFAQGVCFNGDNDDEAVSRDMLLYLPLETCLF